MRIGKKISGGRYKASRKKKKYELPNAPRFVRLNKKKSKSLRTRGGNIKKVLLTCDKANVTDSHGKTKLVVIKNVIETGSNRFWARQNRLIKGAIIDTELGKARITNRPGQENGVNAILIKEQK